LLISKLLLRVRTFASSADSITSVYLLAFLYLEQIISPIPHPTDHRITKTLPLSQITAKKIANMEAGQTTPSHKPPLSITNLQPVQPATQKTQSIKMWINYIAKLIYN
jgi:hypothetical protein